MSNEEEFELIKEFLSGKEKAFNKLVQIHQKNIYWHARRMVNNHADADEITQEVILTIYKKLKKFNFNSSLSTWIYRITHTKSLNLLKRNKFKNIFSLNDRSIQEKYSGEDIIKKLEDKEKIEKVQKMLEKLPLKQKEVFILRHFDELSYKEISLITGKSIGTLKANYFHALTKIKDMMKDEKE